MSLQVRMSWCLMQEKVSTLETDVESVYRRLGGRYTGTMDSEPDPLVTMADVQVAAAVAYSIVDLRTRPVSDQKIGLGLGVASPMLCCETQSCHACRHNDLEGHSNFSSTIYSFSTWNIITEELISGVYLLKS